jgi:hypothetical protein
VKLETAAFSAQQLFLYSSFLYTASQPQPKQTGPKSLVVLRQHTSARVYGGHPSSLLPFAAKTSFSSLGFVSVTKTYLFI